MKKSKSGKNDENAHPFSFLADKKEMDDSIDDKSKPDSTEVTQGDFDSKAGNKKEVFDFL